MGLEQVIGEVRQDGEKRATKIVEDARAEADAAVAEAKQQAQQLADERRRQAEKEAEQVRAQSESHAEFEARKAVLETEAELRRELRQRLVADFAKLDASTRQKHLEKLLGKAKQVITEGTVQGAEQDADWLRENADYDVSGNADIAGGIIVESGDGSVRLDLSYETLLDDQWRDILRQEAGLFS